MEWTKQFFCFVTNSLTVQTEVATIGALQCSHTCSCWGTCVRYTQQWPHLTMLPQHKLQLNSWPVQRFQQKAVYTVDLVKSSIILLLFRKKRIITTSWKRGTRGEVGSHSHNLSLDPRPFWGTRQQKILLSSQTQFCFCVGTFNRQFSSEGHKQKYHFFLPFVLAVHALLVVEETVVCGLLLAAVCLWAEGPVGEGELEAVGDILCVEWVLLEPCLTACNRKKRRQLFLEQILLLAYNTKALITWR